MEKVKQKEEESEDPFEKADYEYRLKEEKKKMEKEYEDYEQEEGNKKNIIKNLIIRI